MSKKLFKLKTEGLEGANLAFVEDLNKRFAEFPEAVTREEITTEVRSAMPGLFNEDGTMKVDATELAKMMDQDTGIRSILSAQGKKLKALEEGGNPGERRTFKQELQKRMKDIDRVFTTGEGEVKFNLRAVMTTDNVVDGYATLPDDLIESFSVGAFIEKRRPREYVFDLANRTTVSQIEQYKTWLEEGDSEGNFAIVAEGGLKPLVSKSLVRNFSTVRKAAGKYVVTEELAKFRRNIYNIIQRLIRMDLMRDYASILTTSLLAEAAAYVGSALDGQYPAETVTDYHAIAAVAAQIESLDFVPDMLVMNPQDKWRIGMSQDTVGQFYLTIPITDPSGQTRMMGFTLRTSNKIPVGNFLLGESGLWEIEEESITVRMGHGVEVIKDGTGTNVVGVESDMDHNRFRVIVENFFHTYIGTNNAGSFVYGNFATIKAALEVVVTP